MSHRFYDGEVFHKRFKGAEHKFTYGFFMLDIDVSSLETLKARLFSYNSWNFFSFFAKDHFGHNRNFLENVQELLRKFDLKATKNMRFLTLPRMTNFVFNPISVLVLFDDKGPIQLMVEVHNYNGGRIVYPVKLDQKSEFKYTGEVKKDMYVSPFLKRDGIYKFTFEYALEKMAITIFLYENGEKTMMTTFHAEAKEFTTKSVLALFLKHSFLSLKVVTRTLWQSLKLYRLGLKFNSVTAVDQTRRY
jgi:DUF1365 family protein